MLLLSDSDLRLALPMDQCIEAMERAFDELSNGDAIIPTRLNLDASQDGYVGLFMPAFSPSLGRSSIKIVSVIADNPAKGRPLIQASLVLNSSQTGETLSTMNGDVLTSIRTAAGSGVATKLLADPEAEVLGIIGTGALARTHLDAMLAVRDIKKLVVAGRSAENTKEFVEEARSKLEGPIVIASDKNAFRECDIICTVTNSDSPIIEIDNLKDRVHLNAVGTYKPHTREIPEEIILASTLVVDEREACLSEPGDIMIPIQEGKMKAGHIYAEIGELVGKSVALPNADLTVFKSVGNGIQDIYAADLAYRTATERGIGEEVDMS